MGDTTIEWTDKTWNPVTGCTKVSAGCKHCYAERVFSRVYGRERVFTDVRCHPERLEQPLHWRKPRRIFVNSMSDLFHEAVPESFLERVFRVMCSAPQHTFQILTKRPQRMREWVAPIMNRIFGLTCLWQMPRNIWLGVSVEDQETADERIPLLLETPAAVRFVSYEPALGPVDFTGLLECACGDYKKDHENGTDRCRQPDDLVHGFKPCAQYTGLDWIIVGGESGPNARPMHPNWARLARDQCQAAGVPYFFKQWGEWIPRSQAAHLSNHDLAVSKSERLTSNGVESFSICVGKRAAGRVLDGREWNEFPS